MNPLHPTAGLLLLWNNVDPLRQREYDCWHTIEHVPERTWVPGFQRATRLRSTGVNGADYLTMYELQSLACLNAAPYRQLVEEPTAWSRSMRPSLRDFLRRTYEVLAVGGHSAGLTTCVRREVGRPDTPALTAAQAQAFAAAMQSRGEASGLCRVIVGRRVDSGPQALPNRDDAPAGEEVVAVLQFAGHVDDALLQEMWHAGVATTRPAWSFSGRYRLLSTVHHADVAAEARPRPRDDLARVGWPQAST